MAVPAPVALGKLERLILGELQPPLNLTGVSQPWVRQVRDARKAMARAAEKWAARGLLAVGPPGRSMVEPDVSSRTRGSPRRPRAQGEADRNHGAPR